MPIYKCKMCGGNIEFNPGDTVGVCDSCGTKQTLPKLDDDRRANLYDRANHFRRNNEFDKAMSIYEKILEEDNTDAETYWSIVLCRYGIEYVEDPATHKRVPTVNRAQYSSVVSDKDYKSALKYGTPEQKELYKAEARAIDKIQKGILEISQKEEPFDVFICYKETDNQGRRTSDSVLANDLYHQLVQEGYKVFFSRITLEDKLGTAYEPYIFAALNSAKVMVVLGTKPEYFNAVWVKNEWSRYLALVNTSGGKKMLIPAYKDMDPYDLPEEFSHLQAQDMSKLGFMQDLIRGIKKIVSVQAPDTVAKTASVISSPVAAGTNTSPLLKRAFMFLEDEEWDRADDFCEQVLNLDPENAQAYLGKMMAELHVRKQDELADLPEPFYSKSNFQKFVRFGDEESVSIVKSYNQKIIERNENNRKLKIYNDAVDAMNTANTESAYKSAAESFKSISEFKDADELAEKCLEYAETCRKAQLYNTAKSYMTGFEVERYEKAIKYFESVSGWKDSDEQISMCQQKIEEIKAKDEADRLETERKTEEQRIAKEKAKQKTKKILKIAIPALAVLIVFIIVLNIVIIPAGKYNKALKLSEEGKYEEAITNFKELEDYKDSEKQIENCKKSIKERDYACAIVLANAEKYEEAISAFKALNGYKDSTEQIIKCENQIKENIYQEALSLITEGKIIEAYDNLIKLDGYKDSKKKADEIVGKYIKAKIKTLRLSVGDTFLFGSYEQISGVSKNNIEWMILAKEKNRVLVISQYALDCSWYCQKRYVTWETCSLRKWLNNDFLHSAFTENEQKIILTVNVSADQNPEKNPEDNLSQGKNTKDQIFLLSYNEVEKYLDSLEKRKCIATEYCLEKGVDTKNYRFKYSMETTACNWWIRTLGASDRACYVSTDGDLNAFGKVINDGYFGIRPAMWISIE